MGSTHTTLRCKALINIPSSVQHGGSPQSTCMMGAGGVHHRLYLALCASSPMFDVSFTMGFHSTPQGSHPDCTSKGTNGRASQKLCLTYPTHTCVWLDSKMVSILSLLC